MTRVHIINIGDELLIGQVVNTNAAWLGQVLSAEGLQVGRVVVVADQREEILAVLQQGLGLAEVVLLTGGLGPTRDDITKEVLCEFFGTELIFNEAAYRSIEAFFAGRHLGVTELNRGQAYLPACCQALPNPHGTAAGMWFEQEGVVIVSMPGVPHELKPMVTERLLPRLRQLYGDGVILHRTILTHGMGESFLAKRIEDWELALPPSLKLAYLPSPGIVRLRLTARGTDRQALQAGIDEAEAGLLEIIPELVFGFDEDTMEAAVGRWLMEKQASLGLAESCTGGYLAHLITSVPGSSRYFAGGIVAYDNRVKQEVLGVEEGMIARHGAVSEEVCRAMAEGARRLLGSDYALASSGIAGPDGGTDVKPVGTTWVAVSGPGGTRSHCFHFGLARERNIRQAALAALNMLRQCE